MSNLYEGSASSAAVSDPLVRLCRSFEEELLGDPPPLLENFLARVSENLRADLLRGLLPIELRFRRERGELPALAEYWDRFPDFTEILLAVFDVLATLQDTGLVFSAHASTSRRDEAGAGGENCTIADTAPVIQEQTLGPTYDAYFAKRYRTVRELGRGSFATVELAFDEILKRHVAVKYPRRDVVLSKRGVEQFKKEAQTLASLNHPRIVPVFDVGQLVGGQWFIISQYIEGGSLKERIEKGNVAHSEAAEIVASIAEALGHAHSMGVRHRDVKPANVLLDATGKPHLSDFGLALHESEQRQRRGEKWGSPAYMAPEQVRGESQWLDGRADIWGLGVVLYELLTGRLPFGGENLEELVDEILHREVRPLRQINAAIPSELEQITFKCLHKSVVKRYSVAADLTADLRAWLHSSRSRPRPEANSRASSAEDATAHLRNLRVLIVEEIAARQSLVENLLKKRGHTTASAATAEQAIALLQCDAWDLVLVQATLPQTDCGAVVQEVRRRATDGNHNYITVVGMTSRPEWQERCLEAGMDGHIARPVQSHELYETLERLMSPLSFASALQRLAGSLEILRDQVEYMLGDIPRYLSGLMEAIAAGKQNKAAHFAHELKGSLRIVDAEQAVQLTRQIETACQNGDFETPSELLPRLQVEVRRVLAALSRWLKRQ